MFEGLFRRAERRINSVVARYIRRALVAVPVVIAVGFATAALTVKLVELYGQTNAYGMMAGVFVALATIAAIVNLASGEPAESAQAPEEATGPDASAKDEPLLSQDVITALMTAAPVALPALPGVARALARNLPLLLLLAVVGYFFTRYLSKPADGQTEETPSADWKPAAADRGSVPRDASSMAA